MEQWRKGEFFLNAIVFFVLMPLLVRNLKSKKTCIFCILFFNASVEKRCGGTNNKGRKKEINLQIINNYAVLSDP